MNPPDNPRSAPFLRRLRHLLAPVDGWGSFRLGARPAAVTAVLYRAEGEWRLPFVSRRADLKDHPSQVALPGGGVEAGEDAWSAAEREVREEIGVSAGRLRPLGAATPVYTAVSNYSVVPFVGWLSGGEPAFVHDPGELDGVLEIPLDRLLADDAWLEAGEPWMGRYFPWEQSMVWGLTARILADLIPRLRAARDG